MTEQINTPELRFPEFRDEWKMKIIKELFNVVSGSTPLRSNTSYYENGNIPWVKTTDLNNSLINDTSEKVTDIALNNLKVLPKDTVLIAMYGGFNQIGRTGILNIKATTNQAISALIKKGNYNSKFLQSYLNFNVKQWRRFAASSRKDPNITKRDIEKFKIPYTCLEEQEKIGTFFSKLDRQIELEEKKLELLEQQKKGYMQKIFSQQLRFKDENGNEYPAWNKTLIKDIFIFENNRRKPITSSLREKGNYPYYGATGIIDYVKDYLFDNEERLLIGEDGAKWGQFETSSFIASGKYWVNNHAHVVKSNDHNLYFMNYYLNFKELRTFVTGNAPAKLTHANLCSISIEMPIRNEQDKISHILKGIENRINKQNIKIQLLQQRKQGLLQKMFV